MIDFTNCLEEINSYSGSEKKKTLIYNGKRYLVKFPDPVREKKRDISYINNAYSEYVGSNVFRLLGMDTQNTILGKYMYKGKEKIVCACEDFTSSNVSLYEFENLAISCNPDKKIGTDIEDIMEVIDDSSDIISVFDTKEKFYDMFVIDAIIGNTNRHNGNWGFLVNRDTKEVKFSPIYDCGSCLNPMYEDSDILKFKESDLKNLALNNYSCIKISGKKIPCISYILSMKDKECNEAILRVLSKFDINLINNFIDDIEGMSVIRKNFYKYLICERYKKIKEVYDKLNI